MIYLMKAEFRTTAMFKVGFTDDLESRMAPYRTHNPGMELVSVLKTYAKTARNLENDIHNELRGMGFTIKHGRGSKGASDWFPVEYDSDLYAALNELGLLAFKSCKGRKELYKR